MRLALTTRIRTAWLDSLELNDFKSYAGHHIIGPLGRSSINCIIGPNGSGKSNLMDALCFVLGVDTKFLRGTRIADLSYRKSNDTQPRTPKVSITLKVADNTSVVFSRCVLDNKSSVYEVDGTQVDKESYIRKLAEYGILPRVQNCIVSQGQVESVSLRTEMEISHMIDEVSGSAELKQKYEEVKAQTYELQNNLNRLTEQRKTIELEYKAVKRQADDLDEWERENEKMEQFRRMIHLYKLYCSSKWLTQAIDRLAVVDGELDRCGAKINEKQLKKRKAEAIVNGKSADLAEAQSELSRLRTDAKHNELAINGIMIELEASTKAHETRIREKVDLELKLNDATGHLKDLRDAIDSALTNETKEVEEFMIVSKTHPFTTLSAERRQKYLKDKEEVSARTRIVNLRLEEVNDRIHAEVERKNAAKIDLGGIEDEISRLSQELKEKDSDDADSGLDAVQQEISTMQMILERKESEYAKQATDIERLERELYAQRTLVESMSGNEDSRTGVLKNILLRLQENIPEGVYDRVTDICELRDHRYGTVVGVALGSQGDSIVVETMEVAQKCVKLLRQWGKRPMDFIPLDEIRPQRSLESVRAHFTLIVDLIEVKESKFRGAIESVLSDTVLAENLKEARIVAFEKSSRLGIQPRVATLDGQVISKNCDITLTSSTRHTFSTKQKQACIQMCSRLQSQLNQLRENEVELNRAILAVEKQLNAKLRDKKRISLELASKKAYMDQLVVSLENSEALRDKLVDILQDEVLKDLGLQRNSLRQQLEKSVADSEAHQLFESYNDLVQNHENRMREIYSTEEALELKITSLARNIGIHEIANVHLQDFARSIQEYIDQRVPIKRVEANIKEMHNKCKTLEVENLSLKDNLKDLQTKMGSTEQNIETIACEITKQKQKIRDIQEGLRKLNHEVHTLALEKIKNEKHLDTLREDRKRSFLEALELQAIPNLVSAICSDPGGGKPANDSEVEVDYSSLPESLLDTGNKATGLAKQIQLEKDLEAAIEALRSKPQNHRAKDTLSGLREQVRNLQDQSNTIGTELRKLQHTRLRISASRKEKFLRCFYHTKDSLAQIYAELTRPPLENFDEAGEAGRLLQKHFSNMPGGTATLELDDPTSGDPFNSGVIFNAMPFGRRYTEMELLSGGERSIATLALIFALQSFRQSPFVILDEVDAALDSVNVDALRKYLSKAPFQVILVTLKEEMYCYGDVLVGVYKDQIAQASGLVTLDVTSYPVENIPGQNSVL